MFNRALVFITLVLTPIVGAAGVDVVYAQNFLAGSRQIVTYPVGNPGALTVIGPQTDILSGMAFDPGTGMLWAINFTTQTVGIVNQSTGTYAPAAPLQAPCCITAFTIDPVRGTYYVSKGDEFIYQLDPVTGTTTLLARGAGFGSQIGALAVDCNSRMYAADGLDGGNLYRVDLAGNPTPLGFPGISRSTSLAFYNTNATLYGWFNPGGDTTSTHATVSTTTAQLSQTSVNSGRYRAAIRNGCSAAQLRLFGDGFEG